ncbi:MAG: restriction endonuclease [bacterium]|nr:restriction endonuclease [bacterium]
MEIQKTSGKREQFLEEKYVESMRSAGVEHSLAQEVARMVTHDKYNLTSTDRLHVATEKVLVAKNDLAAAARYNLARAISDLGPSGYPFEQFISRLFQAYGYKTKTNQIVQGKCVTHEVDVIAQKEDKHYMIECKHHHYPGVKTNVKVALYTHSRFLDVLEIWHQGNDKSKYQAWLVTNTKATKDAITYAECAGMKVMAWHYPKNQGLNQLIEAKGLYPITVLPNLASKSIKVLLKNNYILTSDLKGQSSQDIRRKTNFSNSVISKILEAYQQLSM